MLCRVRKEDTCFGSRGVRLGMNALLVKRGGWLG